MPTPSANVVFVKGGTTVTVPGPPGPTDVNPLPQFVTGQSANHTRWTYKYSGTQTHQWTVPLEALTGAQKAALQTFFDTDVGGPGVTFSYTHTDGNAYTACFTDTSLIWTRNNGEMWSVTIHLETTGIPV